MKKYLLAVQRLNSPQASSSSSMMLRSLSKRSVPAVEHSSSALLSPLRSFRSLSITAPHRSYHSSATGDDTQYAQAPRFPQTPQYPDQVLHLGSWKLTLPIKNSEGKPLEITQPTLKECSYPCLFFVNPNEGGGVIFRTHLGGVTTPNSHYPRTELREMTKEYDLLLRSDLPNGQKPGKGKICVEKESSKRLTCSFTSLKKGGEVVEKIDLDQELPDRDLSRKDLMRLKYKILDEISKRGHTLDYGFNLAKWDIRELNREHKMVVTLRVNCLTQTKPEVVIAQIHGGETAGDLTTFWVEGIKDKPKEAKLYISDHDCSRQFKVTDSYTLGQTITIGLDITNGADCAQNGVVKYFFSSSDKLIPDSKPVYEKQFSGSSCYFKTGNYLQSNRETAPKEPASAYSEVEILDVAVSHGPTK